MNLYSCLIIEIASKKRSDVDKDRDFLVLPLDATKFDTHGEAVKTVLDHFGKVRKTEFDASRREKTFLCT